jgi:hypothetical protein
MPAIDGIISDLRALQFRRRHHMRTRIRIENSTRGFILTHLGWHAVAKDHGEGSKLATAVSDRAHAWVETIRKLNVARTLGLGKDAPLTTHSFVLAFIKARTDKGDDAGQTAADLDGVEDDLFVSKVQIDIALRREAQMEKRMGVLARSLPAYPWVKSVRGFGDLGFAVITAEAGDLSRYQSDDGLKARLGLAPYKGKACSAWRMEGGLTADEWKERHYRPKVRSQMFVIESSLYRSQKPVEGPYYRVCMVYKERQMALNESGAFADRAAQLVVSARKAGRAPDKANLEGRLTQKHINLRALRYMMQKLVSDLWSEWRRANQALPEEATSGVPASTDIENTPARRGRRRANKPVPEEASRALPASPALPPRKQRERGANKRRARRGQPWLRPSLNPIPARGGSGPMTALA